MVTILKKVSESINPSINLYANSQRVAWLQAQNPGENIAAQMHHKALIAQEMLNAGYTRNAMDNFKEILTFIDSQNLSPPSSFIETIRDFHAISSLRLGEERNCLDEHTAESCILPLRGSGIHRYKEGSKQAVDIYTQLLGENPQDFTYRWLLNIAHMTLGEYPAGVPKQWLIPQLFPADSIVFPEFQEIATVTGLDFKSLAGGAVMEDFDLDGFLDILVSSWGSNDQIQLFRNLGNGQFEQQTRQAGLLGITGGLNMMPGDYNNDGFIDILVLRGAWFGADGKHPNSLLKNNGDGTFTDVTLLTGLFSTHPTQTASWGDYNNDGWLDIFIGNETTEDAYHPSELFHNNGDGTFTDVSEKTGLKVIGFIKGVTWIDIDNDKRLDLYISRLGEPNLLYHNLGPDDDGQWKFIEISEKAGVSEPIESFPVWAWDFNNDGWEDIFVSGYSNSSGDVAKNYMGLDHKGESPRLYKNNRDGTFSDVTIEMNLNHPLLTMGCNFGDLDNDGYLDFYVGTGDPDYRSIQPNRMFRNVAGNSFEDVTFHGRFGHLQKGHGVAFGDLDNDGDQDIFSVLGGAYEGSTYQNILFENPGTPGHNWIRLKLEGVQTNRLALGARIELILNNNQKIFRTVTSGGSFGASPFEQFIGVGTAEFIRKIRITWTAFNSVQEFENVKINQSYRIKENSPDLIPIQYVKFKFPLNN